jgi:hypothetical protein
MSLAKKLFGFMILGVFITPIEADAFLGTGICFGNKKCQKRRDVRRAARAEGKKAKAECKANGGKNCRLAGKEARLAKKAELGEKAGVYSADRINRMKARAAGAGAKFNCKNSEIRGTKGWRKQCRQEKRIAKNAVKAQYYEDKINGYSGGAQVVDSGVNPGPGFGFAPQLNCPAGLVLGVNGQCVPNPRAQIIIQQAPAQQAVAMPLGVASGRSLAGKRVGPKYNLDLGQATQVRDVNASNNPYVQTYQQVNDANNNQGTAVEGSLGN